jgi:alanine-glyoxylate transaminase/serine-glyoxylate transaminase/serine-pyruvate transaminase
MLIKGGILGAAQQEGSISAGSRSPVAHDRIQRQILNMSTGPVHVSDGVLRAQLDAYTSPHAASFWPIYDETIALTKRVLKTASETLIMHGSIRIGLDLALGSLIKRGDKVLAITNGFWGEYLARNAEAHGASVVTLKGSLYEPIDPSAVAALLKQHPDVALVTLVHVETNAGIVNPAREIGRLIAETKAIFLLDTACSAGGFLVDTDEWHVDVGVTGSQKTLCGLPGLTVLSISAKAWRKIGVGGPGGFPGHLGLRGLFDANLKRAGPPPTYTQPTSLVLALRAALKEIEAYGVDGWFEWHQCAANMFRSLIRDAGFTLATDAARRQAGRDLDFALAPTVVVINFPSGIDGSQFRALLEEKYGVFVIGNVGELVDSSFRVGLMSSVQTSPRNVLATVASIAATGQQLGFNVNHVGADHAQYIKS